MKGRKGFTLIEMLIVITIIVLLLSLLAVFVNGIMDTARNKKTKAFIDTLTAACAAYKLDFGKYPEDDKGDSRSLHMYLGRERLLDSGKGEVGVQVPKVRRPPCHEFRQDQLADVTGGGTPNPDQPVTPIDAWGIPLGYKGPQAGLNKAVYNKNGVDIWSNGRNGVAELDPTNAKFDDITNWVKDN